MPPKIKITKQALLQKAYEITEQQGIEALTSRSLAAAAGCSVQPVFSHFPTMEELRQETFQYACSRFLEEVMVYRDRPDFPAICSKWTLDLARKRPNLYKLLYLSDGFPHTSMSRMMMDFESNRKMAEHMAAAYGLSTQDCQNILVRSCLFLMGICTMICINHIEITDREALSMMQETVTDMVERKRRN